MAEQSTHETSSAPVAVRGSFTLFGDAWHAYGKNVKSILLFQLILILVSSGIGILFVLVFTGGAAVFLRSIGDGGGSPGAFLTGGGIVLIAVLILVSVLLSVWIGASQLVYFGWLVHGTPQTLRITLKEGWKRVLGLLWIGILQSVILAVGFLLFLIPGIILALRLSQAQFLFFTENVRGRAALKRSWEFTRGISWLVLARYYVFGVIAVLLSIPQMIPLVGPFLIAPFFTTPLLLLWAWLFFGELVRLKKEHPTYVVPYSAGKKAALVLPAFGFAALFVAVLALAFFAEQLPSASERPLPSDFRNIEFPAEGGEGV